jgi:hypothetical protein
MMEAVRASEMSVYFHEATRRYVPEGCHLQHASFLPHGLDVPGHLQTNGKRIPLPVNVLWLPVLNQYFHVGL